MGAREKILVAADQIFGDIGYDAATTREIAESSGVNKALIHYHFKSKEGLFVCVLDQYYAKLRETLVAAILRGKDTHSKLVNMIDVYIDFLADNVNFSRIVQRESSSGQHTKRIADHLMPMFQMTMQLVAENFGEEAKNEMAGHHLLISFYGMIIAYFNFSGIIGDLTGNDPLSKTELEIRKKHIIVMLETLEAGLQK